MKTKIILETLVLAAALTATQAGAAPISLQGSTVTATYNGSAEGMLALDHDYAAVPGGNVTAVDPLDWPGVEFFTADALFGFDFTTTGQLSIFTNNFIPSPGDYRMVFDFGAGFAQRIGGFTVLDTSGVDSLPVLSVLNDHSIEIDLSQVAWNSQFGVFSAQIDAAAAVPEPGSIGLVLAGVAGLAMSRRRKGAARAQR